MQNLAITIVRASLVAVATLSVTTSFAKLPAEASSKIICKWDYCDSDRLRYCSKIIIINDQDGTVSFENYDSGKLSLVTGAVVTRNEIKWDQEGSPTQPDSEIGTSTHRDYFTISRLNGEYSRYSLFKVGNEILLRDEMLERALNGTKAGKQLASPVGVGLPIKGKCEPYQTKF